jgi:hypothetical protein
VKLLLDNNTRKPGGTMIANETPATTQPRFFCSTCGAERLVERGRPTVCSFIKCSDVTRDFDNEQAEVRNE